MATRDRETTTVNRNYVITEMMRRGLNMEAMADRAKIHVNTLAKALAGMPIDVETAQRMALVFKLQRPDPHLDAMIEPDGIDPSFPIVIKPMDRHGLSLDEPILRAEQDWYDLPLTARAKWAARAARIKLGTGRRGNFMTGGREWGLSDVIAFIAEQRHEAISP